MHFVLLLFLSLKWSESAKILGVYHLPAYSHFQLGDKILKELVARGHEVTVITPFLNKNPPKNYKQVYLDGFIAELEKVKVNLYDQSNIGVIGKNIWLDMLGIHFTESVLNHTNVQKLLKSEEKFDVVILEQFVDEAFKGFCYYYDAVCVMQSTLFASRWTNPQMGNPGPPSVVLDPQIGQSAKMNFWGRLSNTFAYVVGEFTNHFYTFRKHNELLQRYFPGAPHLYELYFNASLMLLNSHVSLNPAVPLVPNMIEIGGFHVSPPKKLPQDLQQYLDNAKEGVIYFSMGSNLKSTQLPAHKRDALLRCFSKLKEKVLWKWENETLPGQPSNVKLEKWLPQQDILGHPNVKLFITHGGLLSGIETIYHGKPILGIPVFGDQEMNLANAANAGYGLSVPFREFTEEKFGASLNEILSNPKYAEEAKRRSKIMHDQPMKPLDKAMFWIEYVLRHKGAPHLRTAALNLTWYQYLLLDVIGFVIGIVIIVLLVLKAVLKRLFGKKSKVTKDKKKN